MAVAVKHILELFEEPQALDGAISALSQKYSTATLSKLLSYMADKHILIDEHDADLIQNSGNDFLGKAFFYTSGGKGLQEVIDTLAPLHIGILGTYLQANSLVHELAKSDLLHHFHVAVTDYEAEINVANDNVHITNYPILSGSFIPSVINASDMIIAAFNYNDHYMLNKINEECFAAGKKWLRVIADGLYAEIGPLFEPKDSCCYACLYTRWRRNMAKEEYVFNDLFETQAFHKEAKTKTAVFSALYPLYTITAGVAVAEIFKHFTGMPCLLKNQVLSVSAQDFHTQTHYIFKDYQCPVCVKAGG